MQYPYRYVQNAEVLGAAAHAIIKHMAEDEIGPLLDIHGLGTIYPDAWYDVNGFIDLFGDWYAQHPHMLMSLTGVGVAMTQSIALPPEFDALQVAHKLMLIDQLYQQQHRCGDVGGYLCERMDERHIRYTENTIYPDHLIYGYIYGVARAFLPRGSHFTVQYDETVPRQDAGGAVTLIHLFW